jgi:hypothetical protein
LYFLWGAWGLCFDICFTLSIQVSRRVAVGITKKKKKKKKKGNQNLPYLNHVPPPPPPLPLYVKKGQVVRYHMHFADLRNSARYDRAFGGRPSECVMSNVDQGFKIILRVRRYHSRNRPYGRDWQIRSGLQTKLRYRHNLMRKKIGSVFKRWG